MTWRDNLRAASSEDGFIIAGGSGTSLIPQNTNWHDNYMNSFTEDGIKIANLKSAVNKVSTLPTTGDTSVLYFLDSDENPGMYYYDGEEWATVGGGGGGVTPEQLDARVKQMAGTPTTSTEGIVGQLIEDTTNGKLYQCTAIASTAGVDTEAGLTSKVNNVTFTISNATTLNSKLSGFTLTTGVNYAVAKGAGNSFVVTNFDTSTNIGTLAGVAPATLASTLGVTPNPQVAWLTAFNQAPNGMPFFTFKMAAGLLSYTWTEVGAGPIVVQTTGSSTTDVMSQNAVCGLIYSNPASQEYVKIGKSTTVGVTGIAVGDYASARGTQSLAVGRSASTGNGYNNVALGYNTSCGNYQGIVALGAGAGVNGSTATESGLVLIDTTNSAWGFRNTFTRVIRGLHDGVASTDAVTLNQISQLITAINSACGTNIMLASDGSITNANNNQDPGSNEEPNPDEPSPDDPSDPSDPSDPDEPGPDDVEAPMEG